jgi:hypothetical protein
VPLKKTDVIDVSDVPVCSKCIQLKDQLEYSQMGLKSLQLAAKLLQDGSVQITLNL